MTPDTLPAIQRLDHQLNWCRRQSRFYQISYWISSLLKIIAVSIVPALPTFHTLNLLNDRDTIAISALLGSLVLCIETIQQTAQLHRHSITFNLASHQLERERSLYKNHAGAYASSRNPRRLLTERVESILSSLAERWSSAETRIIEREEISGRHHPRCAPKA